MSAHPNVLSKCAVIFVELMMIMFIVLPAFFGYKMHKEDPETSKAIVIGLLTFAALMFIFFVGFNCLLYCFYHEFDIAIQIVDTTADFYNDTYRLFLVSLYYLVI